jgi:hypothetical protein
MRLCSAFIRPGGARMRRRRKKAEYIRSGGTGVSAGFQPRRSLEPTKSGYATAVRLPLLYDRQDDAVCWYGAAFICHGATPVKPA